MNTAPHAGEARDKLAADLKAVIRDAEELLKSSGEQAGDTYQSARARLASTLESAKSGLSTAQESLVARTKDIAQSTDEYVQANPWRSVGIAAVVGLAVGVLLGYGRD
ncbi:MAG TPA: DUF883 family protein [Paucimonas sp.]|nr:DUF883 family protein [Paucimonas sp.]